MRRVFDTWRMSDVLSSGVFWTAVGSVAAVIVAIVAVLGLRGKVDPQPWAKSDGSHDDEMRVGPSHEALRPEPRHVVTFGIGWEELALPIRARVGVIDKSDSLEIGLTARQLRNMAHTGKYNAVVTSFLGNKTRARTYNAFGMKALEGSEIRISSALAEYLGCRAGEEILIESLAIIDD